MHATIGGMASVYSKPLILDLARLYTQLASVYHQMGDLLSTAEVPMPADPGLNLDALEAHAAALRERIKEAEAKWSQED